MSLSSSLLRQLQTSLKRSLQNSSSQRYSSKPIFFRDAFKTTNRSTLWTQLQLKSNPPPSKFSKFFFPNATYSSSKSLPPISSPSVGYWLLASSALVYGIIVVGGVTRLTESGLSITEWKPITGILPPLNRGEWEIEFDKYKATPEFKLYDCLYFLLFLA